MRARTKCTAAGDEISMTKAGKLVVLVLRKTSNFEKRYDENESSVPPSAVNAIRRGCNPNVGGLNDISPMAAPRGLKAVASVYAG